MSDEKATPALADRVAALATEIVTLRESIVTAAEWDAEARRVRQLALDTTLATVRTWLRVLVGVHVALLAVVLWLLVRLGT